MQHRANLRSSLLTLTLGVASTSGIPAQSGVSGWVRINPASLAGVSAPQVFVRPPIGRAVEYNAGSRSYRLRWAVRPPPPARPVPEPVTAPVRGGKFTPRSHSALGLFTDGCCITGRVGGRQKGPKGKRVGAPSAGKAVAGGRITKPASRPTTRSMAKRGQC